MAILDAFTGGAGQALSECSPSAQIQSIGDTRGSR
jgi:hypothetical protein